MNQSTPTVNFGTDAEIRLKNSSTKMKEAFLKFDVEMGGPIESAKLKIYAQKAMADVTVWAVNDNSWIETGITWNTKPAAGARMGSSSPVAGGWVEIDLANHITTGR